MGFVVNDENLNEISLITRMIHGCKFDREKVFFNSTNATLGIPFYRDAWEKRKLVNRFLVFKKVLIPVEELTMVVSGVERIHAEGNIVAGPGPEDFFNEVAYDGKKKQICISTVIGKDICLDVDKFRISIGEPKRIVGEKRRFVLF